jgi:hypothetical protein
MIIIKVNKPFQDQFTRDENVELIDGEKKFWFTYTSLYTEKQGGHEQFMIDIEKTVLKKGFKGIYLYEIGTYDRNIKTFGVEMEKVWYIRWDFYN